MIFAVQQKGEKMDDLISRQMAMDALLHNEDVYSNHFGDDPIDKYTVAIIDNDVQTVTQLPSAQPEQTDCEYCHEDVDDYVKPIEKNGHAFVRFGMNGWELSLKANRWHGSAKIRYCPMCGRDLHAK